MQGKEQRDTLTPLKKSGTPERKQHHCKIIPAELSSDVDGGGNGLKL